jgi:hypothetical protein
LKSLPTGRGSRPEAFSEKFFNFRNCESASATSSIDAPDGATGCGAMKITIQRLSVGCLMLALAHGSMLAQESKTAPAPVKAKRESGAKSNTTQEQVETPDLRKLHLRMLKESTLLRTVDNIKSMDEAALRISARNQLLTYLSAVPSPSAEHKSIATQIASAAIADFSEHGEEIPTFMADYLLSDLGAWIQKYQPKLREAFQAAEKNRKNSKESDRIRALLQLEGGSALAVRRIRQLLEEGQDVDGLNFYLDDLRKQNSKELEPLLSEILNFAEREQQVSFERLFWVSDSYLQAKLPVALKRRFLAMVITRTQPANFVFVPAPQMAYDLLTKSLPFIQELSPELYDQAVAQSASLRASFTERELATEERNKRIKESPNPIEDLIAEAEAAKSKVERNELLSGAARLAIEKKKFAQCLEIVSKLDLKMSAASTDFWQHWADQFLKDFVKATLTSKEPELAEKGAGRIGSPLARVESLVLIMRYWGKANDQTAAQRLLAEALKIAAAAPDHVEKAKAFFLLSITCDSADESQKAALLESGIKALNNVSRPDSSASDKKPYQQYVRNLDNTGYQLVRGFKELTKKDENGAVALVEKLQKPDLRIFATIGILFGMNDLLANAK